MSLLSRYKIFSETPTRPPSLEQSGYSVGQPVRNSRDLQRIVELPVKSVGNYITYYSELLRRKDIAKCECKTKFSRNCVTELHYEQAQALHEIADQTDRVGKAVGLFAPLAVGSGKTLLDLLSPLVVPDCKRAVLLIPPQLRAQLLTIDWPFYAQHWRLPNLAGARYFNPALPTVHVISYSELSSAKSTDLLEKLQPDLIIADEAHLVRNRTAARTKRFLRYFHSRPGTRFLCWSGTLTSKSLKDYAHLAELALGEGSPVPLHYPEVEAWAEAIDPSDWPAPIGELKQLCQPGEHVRDGFRRRMLSTKGVVATTAKGGCNAALVVARRDPPMVPMSVVSALKSVERSWTRPDGEELVDSLSWAACMRQLACGFYYRWVYPRGEPVEVINDWFQKRQAWHRELRDKLKHPRVHLDSPLLCTKAAIRATEGYRGELPVWHSTSWAAWRDIRASVVPQTATVWVSDWLARDAAAWAKENTGIVWILFKAFGEKVSELSDKKLYAGGREAAEQIILERGDKSIIASANAYGQGFNLQMFNKSLVANMPPSGSVWEQMLGRTHRTGQLADEVTCDVYLHTTEVTQGFEKARKEAVYIQQSFGSPQKLCMAQIVQVSETSLLRKVLK